MNQAFICDGVRTPIGRYGGALAQVRADDLAALPLRVLLERYPQVDWAQLDDVILGCANQAGEDNRNLARMALLLAGLPVGVSGTTVNRLCGSGLDALAMAARSIKAGDAGLMLAGGAESMTRAPLVMGKADSAFSRQAQLYDTTLGWRFVNPRMQAEFGTDSMPETAENVAAQFNISRADQDAFALRSQQRAARAQALGYLAQEIAPVSLTGKKGAVTLFSQDEHPRADTTFDQLQALKTPFRQPGSVTAGNASGLNDGAAALIVASEAMAARQGLTPRAHPCHRHLRRGAAADGHRPAAGHPQGAGDRRAEPGADGRHRTERSVRRPGVGGDAPAWPAGRCPAGQPQRRRDRSGAPAGHERRAPGAGRPV